MCLRCLRRASILHFKATWKITNFLHYHSVNVDKRIARQIIQLTAVQRYTCTNFIKKLIGTREINYIRIVGIALEPGCN